MLRSAVKEGTEFGRKAKEIMDRGELVSDEIMGGVVEERLDRADTRNRGYILAGFPRTVRQAELLAQITQAEPLDPVIDLLVPTPLLLDLLAPPPACPACRPTPPL